jgi:hypothetical protein
MPGLVSSQAEKSCGPRADVKLWVDDIRSPPDASWLWARRNRVAQEVLLTGAVSEVSLDRDMWFWDVDIDDEQTWRADFRAENGELLVEWMIERGCVPETVEIHSWNLEAAKRMTLRLNEAGYRPSYRAADA